MTNTPYTFGEATDVANAKSAAQEAAEEFMRDSAKHAAEAEERYRVKLAKRMVELHADGVGWSTTAELARGEESVARLRKDFKIAEGVREAASQAAWRRAADRKDAQRFIDWSMRRDLAEDPPPPDDHIPTIGGRRAA